MSLKTVLIAFLWLCCSAEAQQTPRKSSAPDLSGFWERKDDTGSGSFGGTLEKIPRASLKPEVIEANRQAAARQQAGDVVSFGSKWCLTNQYPFFMQHSAAWDIAQTDDEIVFVPEVHTFTRHIYLDGRTHPDTAHLQRTVNGHSIGHWEAETLVVDTFGFIGGGGVPGGGRTTPNTHLVERIRLLDEGKRLSVNYAWEDPGIYLKPHSYEMTYYKSAPGTYAFEEFCDASDPKQWGSVVEPPQK